MPRTRFAAAVTSRATLRWSRPGCQALVGLEGGQDEQHIGGRLDLRRAGTSDLVGEPAEDGSQCLPAPDVAV